MSSVEYQETACRSAKALNLPLLNINNLIMEAIAMGETSGAKKLAQQIDARFKELISKLNRIMSSKRGGDVYPILTRLPQQQDFEKMDTWSAYEYKLELMEFISQISEPDKPNVKGKPSQTGITNEVSIDIIKDILQDR